MIPFPIKAKTIEHKIYFIVKTVTILPSFAQKDNTRKSDDYQKCVNYEIVVITKACARLISPCPGAGQEQRADAEPGLARMQRPYPRLASS
jgi:hypothetical protein